MALGWGPARFGGASAPGSRPCPEAPPPPEGEQADDAGAEHHEARRLRDGRDRAEEAVAEDVPRPVEPAVEIQRVRVEARAGAERQRPEAVDRLAVPGIQHRRDRPEERARPGVERVDLAVALVADQEVAGEIAEARRR